MNRWLRGLGVVFVLMSANSAVFAVCEVELEETIQNRVAICNFIKNEKDPQRFCGVENQRNNSNIAYKANVNSDLTDSKEFLQLKIRDAEKKIKDFENSLQGKPTCPGLIASEMECRLRAKSELADAKLEICRIKYGGGRLLNNSSTTANSNTNIQTEQPSPTNKPGTSTLDRYLAAPKEDCDAIPQSYNVSDRQQAVSQCRLRNANRDKYAANANAASAQPATNEQSAQQKAQQAQQAATIHQVRADQARQGKRRRHEPENEASHCIQPDFGGLFGGMKNTCNFKVWYTYCGYRPKESSWLTGMNCEKQSFGSDSVSPGRTSASHTKGVEMLYWLACKEPAWTVDTEFVPGQGLRGRCYTVGGN